MSEEIGEIATRGLFWVLAQNWGGRIITFGIFTLLARLLSPNDYGIASAAILVITFAGLLAEFGFGEAIIQQRSLEADDLVVPFAVSIVISLILAVVVFVSADWIEGAMDAVGVAPVLKSLCVIPVLTTITAFQEASLKRALAFRRLAFRVISSNVAGGIVAVICAYLGAGVWALVVQAYVVAIVGLAWLWWSPAWVPGCVFPVAHFAGMSRFAGAVLSMRVIDFVAMRFVDFIILRNYGPGVFGIYSVGARLYQILLQLLQAVLNDISLPVLSMISSDFERLRSIYLRSITFAAYFTVPVFVLFAALSREICHVLFGGKWTGVENISAPLLVVGAVQSMQYLNGPYITARGKPGKVMSITCMRYAIIILGLFFVHASNVQYLVMLFAALQISSSPISFGMVGHELKLNVPDFAKIMIPAIVGNCIAALAVFFVRSVVVDYLHDDFIRGICLGAVFVVSLLGIQIVIARPQIMSIYSFISNKILKRKAL